MISTILSASISPRETLARETQIPLRLTPSEMDHAQRAADSMGVSRSALARAAYRAGLPIISRSTDSLSQGNTSGTFPSVAAAPTSSSPAAATDDFFQPTQNFGGDHA